MKSKKNWIKSRQSLRTEAEGMLPKLSPVPDLNAPIDVVLHELLVHKVELEMQVEELRRTHEAMEEARDRYLDLYDFAPVGYITLNRECLITEINLTGAELLGVHRAKLLQRRFTRFVSPQDQDLWHCLFIRLMEQPEPGKQTLVLEMTRVDAAPFYGYLECQHHISSTGATTLRLALFDISKIRQTEAEMMRQAAAIALDNIKR